MRLPGTRAVVGRALDCGMEGKKIARGAAGQFFVAGELSRRGYLVGVMVGNTPNIDLLCSNSSATRFVHIQVKTFRPGARTCTVGVRAQRDYGPSFFWILAGIPEAAQEAPFSYFVIPSADMAQNIGQEHADWLTGTGRKGQQRQDNPVRIVRIPPYRSTGHWDVTPFREQWQLIEAQLGE
jgi:hypothetical protein